MKKSIAKIMSVLLALTMSSSVLQSKLIMPVYAIGGNENGGTFTDPYPVTPDTSENKLGLQLIPSITTPTNDNVNITAYATQSVNYIIRYAKVVIPEFELVESSKENVGTVRIEIPDLKATLQGSGSGSGKVEGSVSGTASGTVSGGISGNYSSSGWYGSGSGSVSGSVQGQVGGNVSGTIAVSVGGTLTGTVHGIGSVTGTSTVKVPTYTLVKHMTKEYNVPYVIPIYTQITTPQGTYDGNMAKFTATQNGTYTFTSRDTLGNTKTETITVSNIDKDKMDIKQWHTDKTYDSKGSIVKLLTEKNVDELGIVRAYTLNSKTKDLESSYGFFLQVKETYSKFNLTQLQQSGGIAMPVVTRDVGIAPETFYKTDLAIENRDTLFSSLSNLSDGIYVNPNTKNGYRTLFIKSTQAKSVGNTRNMALSIENNAGTVVNKSFIVEIEDKPNSYITADNNFKSTTDKLNTIIFTRTDTVKLNNIAEVYDLETYSSQVNLRKEGTSDEIRFEPSVNMSDSFKDTNLKQIEYTLDMKEGIQSYDVATILTEHSIRNNPTVIYNSNYNSKLHIIKNPVDTMLQLNLLNQSINGNNLSISFTPQLNTSNAKLNQLMTQFDLKSSDFKVALVDYSGNGSTSVPKVTSLAKLEDILTSNKAKGLGQSLTGSIDSSSDIRLVFGIPGVFVDVAPINSELSVNIYNVDESEPLVTDFTEANPFTINVSVESNGVKYTLPRDLEKMKNEGQIKSLELSVDSRRFDILQLPLAEAQKAFNIVDEGIYYVQVKATNLYNTTKADAKTLNIIKTETIKNSQRLKNDPTILLTKEGIYDLHTKRFKKYTIQNVVDNNTGSSIKGIRLTNNNIVLVSTKGNQGEIFSSTLESLGTFSLTSVALDIIQYGNDVLIANGTNGISILNAEDPTKQINQTLPLDSSIKAPVYCLEKLNSMLLVGSENQEALRVYINNPDGGFDLKEKLTADEVYETGTSTQIKQLTVRNNKLEVYPGLGNYHVIIELP